ncbi:MAG: hypothetical protein JNK04_20835, partial [Myxococcales bacterium]|nr:hypothetical protein [Myxococcales bacterium]
SELRGGGVTPRRESGGTMFGTEGRGASESRPFGSPGWEPGRAGGSETEGKGPNEPCGGDEAPERPRKTLISGIDPRSPILRGGGATGGSLETEPSPLFPGRSESKL